MIDSEQGSSNLDMQILLHKNVQQDFLLQKSYAEKQKKSENLHSYFMDSETAV